MQRVIRFVLIVAFFIILLQSYLLKTTNTQLKQSKDEVKALELELVSIANHYSKMGEILSSKESENEELNKEIEAKKREILSKKELKNETNKSFNSSHTLDAGEFILKRLRGGESKDAN